jgi:hypothetical protein
LLGPASKPAPPIAAAIVSWISRVFDFIGFSLCSPEPPSLKTSLETSLM